MNSCKSVSCVLELILSLSALSSAKGQTQNIAQHFLAKPRFDSVAVSHGYVRIISNVKHFLAIVDDVWTTPIDLSNEDSLKLTVGKHKLLLTSEKTFDVDWELSIIADSTLLLKFQQDTNRTPVQMRRSSSYPRLMRKANLEILSDEDSDILVDNELIGRGYALIDAPPGQHILTVRHEALGDEEQKIILKNNRLIRVELYNRPSNKFTNSFFIPGLVQLQRKERFKGVAILGLTVVGLTASYRYNQLIKADNDAFVVANLAYEKAGNEPDAIRLGQEVGAQYDMAAKHSRVRDVCLYFTAAVFFYSIIDALSEPEFGFRKVPNIPFDISMRSLESSQLTVTLKTSF